MNKDRILYVKGMGRGSFEIVWRGNCVVSMRRRARIYIKGFEIIRNIVQGLVKVRRGVISWLIGS